MHSEVKKFLGAILTAVLLLSACSSGSAPRQKPEFKSVSVDLFPTDYVSAQELLAADDFDGAREALAQLAASSQGPLGELALAAAEAEEILAMRVAFVPLSNHVISMIGVPPGHRVAFCPMADNSKGARWIQQGTGELSNPYFGAQMLRCGVFESE